jgi:hypothetical protein
VANDPDMDRQLVLITYIPLERIAIVQLVYNDWRMRSHIEYSYRSDQEQGLAVEDRRVDALERIYRLFAIVFLPAQIMFLIEVLWPPKGSCGYGNWVANWDWDQTGMAFIGCCAGYRHCGGHDGIIYFLAPFSAWGEYLWVITKH